MKLKHGCRNGILRNIAMNEQPSHWIKILNFKNYQIKSQIVSRTRKQVLVITSSHLGRDPRVYRQIIWLENTYDVTAVSYDRPNITNIKFIKFPKIQNSLWQKLYFGIFLKLGKFEQYYWSNPMFKLALKKIKDQCFDSIIANDIEVLPLACFLKQKYKWERILHGSPPFGYHIWRWINLIKWSDYYNIQYT